MDKNKSRTDMLAAGRQKLQQFRQKKDGKGSSSRGKSSKKSNKSDTDAASSVGKPTVSSQVSEGETVAFIPSGLDTTAVVSSLEPSVSLTGNVETVVAYNAGVPVEVDSSVSNGGESTQCVDSMVSTEIHSSTADIPVSEGETEHNIVPQPSTSVDTVEGTVVKLNLVDSNEGTGQNPLFTRDDFPDTTLSQASGDQVTDIGAMQEADGLGLNQFDRGGETEFEIDGKLPLSEHGECAKSPEGETSEVTGLQGPSSEAKQAISRDDASVSIGAASSSQPEESFAASYQLTNKLAGEAIPCSHVDEKQAMGSPFGDYGDDKTLEEKQQCLPKGSFVSRDGSHERSHLTKFAGLPDPVLSLVRDGSPVRLPQLAEMIRSLDEDEYRHLLNLQALVSIADVATYGLALAYHSDLFEKVKEELYLTSSTKDIFYLQLAEQSDLHMQSDHHCQQLIDEISKNACLVEELAQCRSELRVFASEREELQSQYNTLVDQKMSFHENEKLLKELADCRAMIAALQVEHSDISKSLALMTEERMKLEEEKELLALGKEKTALDLEEYKDLLAALQVEKSNLNGNLALVTEERKKLDEEKEYFVHENKRLASDLLVLQEQFATEHGQHIQLEAELKEVTVQLEKLMEENNFLNASLDVHKAKIAESESRATHNVKAGSQVKNLDAVSGVHENATEQEHSCQIPWKRDPELSTVVLEKALPDDVGGLSLALHEQEIFDESSGFLVLKEHLKEAERILQNLGMAIEQIHSHSMSLQQSSSKPVVPGVSKLIQAFESRVPHDEPKVEERGLTECQSLGDLLDSTKEITEALRAVLKLLVQDADNASSLYRGERNCRKSANLTFGELMVLHESLKEYSNNLEATNIELAVLYEAIKQHALLVEAKNKEFEVLYEALKQQESICSSENAELCQKLSDYQLRLTEMQGDFSDLQKRSDEMASDLYKQLESSQEEAAERALMVELEWKSKLTRIVETVRMLDGYVGRLSNSSFSNNSNDVLDTSSQVTTSVTSAINSIQDLQEKLEAANAGHDAMSSSYKEVDEKYNDLLRMNEVMTQILQKMYNGLKKLLIDSCALVGEAEMNPKVEKLPNLLDYSKYTIFIEQLENVLGERLHLQSVNDQLNSELVNRTRDFEEMSKECLNSNAIRKLIEHVENVVELGDYEIDSYKTPGSRLELLVYLLVKKYKEIVELASELSSVREKLSIAVAKGKGLVVQRDGLKQSLAETSAELERCSQELQAKDARLQELEIKLKTYSEAGERVEALESELSYIRNSATALRESFLLKDSVLQRIEEILEELDLPEHFYSRDIIEKVDWLVKSTTGNSLPPTDWDQKSFVPVDTWKEDPQQGSTLGEDLRRKYEDLQGALDGINMPSQMQSMEPEEKIEWLGRAFTEANHERNSLQKKIDNLENYFGSLAADLEGPEKRVADLEADLQSVTLERDQLSEKLETMTSNHHNLSAKAAQFEVENENLQGKIYRLAERNEQLEMERSHLKIDNLENYYGSLAADLEESEKRVADLGADLQSVTLKRDKLSEKLETMTSNHHNVSAKAAHFEVENENLQIRVKWRREEHLLRMDGEIRRLQHLISDVLPDADAKDLVSGGSSTACLERLLNKLIENYTNLKSMNPDLVDVEKDQPKISDASLDEARSRDALTTEEDVASLKKKLEAMLHDLMQVKDERDEIFGKHQSLLHEVQALERKREELQELLNQEEQKSASLREKLNLAVRKGKSLVQQRDSLKKTTEDMNAELERLKSEFSHRENALADYELKMRDFSAYRERRMLEEKGLLLSRILNAIADIDVGNEINISDPVEKLEQIEKVCHDLHAAAASSEQESRKSKTAAELLLAELNEVQERNDGLQEDLAKLASELTEVSTLKKKRKQYSELIMLQSSLDALRNGVNNVIVKLCLEGGDAQDMSGWPYSTSSNLEDKENIQFVETWPVANMQDPMDDKSIVEVCELKIAALKEKLIVQSKSLQEKGHGIWNVLEILHREKKSQKESFEAMRRNIMHLESVGEERDMEILVLRRNIAFIYEACANSVLEIENQKAELLGNNLGTADLGTKMKPVILADGVRSLSGQNIVSAEKNIKTMADKLFSTVKDFLRMKAEITEGSQREMRITIANLQKELQEKDIQKDRICMELVSQIKLAEASSTNYSRDLQSSKTMVYDLEKELEVMREEQTSLQQRVKELENVQTNTVELQDRVKSLTDVLSSKDQGIFEILICDCYSLTEIEALMQALDEEEVQMEELTKKIEELEKVLQQKNTDLENLEASRGKVVKKLSVTVSRFDELRDLSESLITKVEQLQSQLQDRDAEISFLRQEVTRCTNDEIIQRRIISIISETGKTYGGLLKIGMNCCKQNGVKWEELTRREETLKKTLHEKESQLNLLEGVGDVGQAAGLISEIVEVEPVINKRAIAGTSTASQVRSLRKVNTDQVAIPIDADDGNNSRLEDEDEDKVHGFKSLTTSRVVPRFTRPITDMIDGLWVSCDRALMRQPALRLGIIIYWALLHTLLGAFVF
ncbi:hypothetical protein ES332_D05G070500v1 [Gossypium tomentosum]|uniref:Uncharacterized protein n=1 Tax=Gossypium tomentosum TaxID=34277 RepID=A0A5D2KRE0_GOSTO|nr:hypothetical protein ES332_D05G070500v1 [Gossypium tomentosum]